MLYKKVTGYYIKGGEVIVIYDEIIQIKESQSYQKIEGFGASGAWWSQEIGGWHDANRNKIVDLLFDKEKGIGLSIFRYNIGAGSGKNIKDPWRRSCTIEKEPGVYDLKKDKNAIWVLLQAKEKGVENFVAFANSPPARMTISGHVTGNFDGSSNLKEDMYETFADYLIDVIRELRKVDIHVKYVSPINEPQWDWKEIKGQEGCHYTIEECLNMVKVLDKKIKLLDIELEISAIDAGDWKKAINYADKLFTDETLTNSLKHFSGHSYFTKTKHKVAFINKFNKSFNNKKLWMSEWTEMVEGRDYGMDSALIMANTIHEDMTILSVTSWQYWIAVSKYDYRDGLIYTNEGREDVIETKRLYAYGNYSKYIRPGFIRNGSSVMNNRLKVTSYTDRTDDKLILVVINNEDREVNSEIKLEKEYLSTKVYVTDKIYNLQEVYEGKSIHTFNFLPQSVTTMVYEPVSS